MTMLSINHDKLRGIISQLDQAIYNHNQWYESLIRTLICRMAFDRRDVERDAHKVCRFGQWFYYQAPPEIKDHPGFVALETEHKRMHTLAAGLLMTEASGGTIPLLDYETFNISFNNLHLQLQTLKHEHEDLLYNHDPLTHAYSRIGMLTKLRELQELIKRNIEYCSIAMIDLDNFKSINDTYGHQAGDHVLATVAEYIMMHIRPYDKLFRYGGEEFLISMQHTDLKTGLSTVERLREGIAASVISYESGEIRITASFGLTLLDPDISAEQSVERADKALYAAKVAGKNCTRVWDISLNRSIGGSVE